MKDRTERKLARVAEGHDWDEHGVRARGGTAMDERSVCRYCGLERLWFTDPQNGVDNRYTFTRDGAEVPLVDVVDSCEEGS